MKKALLWLLLLTVPFTFGCPPPRNENAANADANKTVNGNMNQVGADNVNADSLAATASASDKAVAIIIRFKDDDPTKEKEIIVSQNSIKLKKNVAKLRFSAFNNVNVDIKDVVIEFAVTGSATKKIDPFDGTPPFKIDGVKAGEDDKSQKRKAVGEYGKYPYKITVNWADGSAPLILDPEIEIGT